MKQTSKIRYLLLIILIAASAGIGLIGVNILRIEKITVFGNINFMYNDIISMSGISLGQNILKLNKELAYQKVESNPYIDVISISSEYPGEVTITVRERAAVAVVEYFSSHILIDVAGIALEARDEPADFGLMIVRGMDIQGFVLGKVLMVADLHKLNTLELVLNGIYAQELQNDISYIIIEDLDNIRIISDNGTSIKIGQAVDIEKKLIWMRTEEFEQLEVGDFPGELDLSVPDQAVFRPLQN